MHSENDIQRKKCREHIFYLFNLITQFLPILGTLTLFTLPALIHGCSSVPPTGERTTAISLQFQSVSGPDKEGNCLDVFVFNDDKLCRLDSYQRFENWKSGVHEIASCSGEKILFAIANSKFGRFSWSQVNSLDGMEKITVRLEDEMPDNPVMSGIVKIRAGDKKGEKLVLKPLRSIIEIRSVRCDFRNLPYEGERITDARAYLTNVNAECSVAASGAVSPVRIINIGSLDTEAVEGFRNKESILYEFKNEIGKTEVKENIRFACYPSSAAEESPGSPFTRLVLEGKISGNTYYWAFPVNIESGSEKGILRNCHYIFDLDIRRKGTASADIDISAEDVSVNMEVGQWKEKDIYDILF